MALEELLPFLDFVPEFLRELPTILFWLQILGYILLIMFFGSISVKGFRGYANYFIKLGSRFGLGLLALITGYALSNVLPIFQEGFFSMLQADVFIFGLISAIILYFAVFMITFNIMNAEGIAVQIKKLQEKLKKAAEIKGKKIAPISIIGMVVLIALIVISVLFFRGFPSMIEEIGLTEDDLNTLADEIDAISGQGDLPDECVSLVILARDIGVEDLMSSPHEDAAAAALMEEYTGSTVLQTYIVTYDGKDIIIGVTVDEHVCSVLNGELCECFSV